MKASIDNRPTQKLDDTTLKAKSLLAKSMQKSEINNKNGILLNRIFKIFNRDRPEMKGFDLHGRPSLSPKYGNQTLNLKNRKDEAIEINKRNAQMMRKLQSVKPKVVSFKEWNQHA